MNLVAVVVAALMVGVPVSPDLGGYLERSSEAEFTGEQLVACETPDGSRSSVFNLAQTDGTVVAWEGGEDTPLVGVAPGLSVTVTGESVESSVVEGSAVVDSDQYTVEEAGESTYLGRPVNEVSLVRDGTERVRMSVDSDTDAVLRTITYADDGSSYCDRRLLSFEEDLSGVPELAVDAAAEPASPIDEDPEDLKSTIEGFELVDTYSLDDGTLSYYSDGFFSAGVAITRRPISFGESDDVVEFAGEAGKYQRSYQAGSVTVTWDADPGNMVLIGDLPPDLLESFLDELPPPDQDNFFDRIWSRLFG